MADKIKEKKKKNGQMIDVHGAGANGRKFKL